MLGTVECLAADFVLIGSLVGVARYPQSRVSSTNFSLQMVGFLAVAPFIPSTSTVSPDPPNAHRQSAARSLTASKKAEPEVRPPTTEPLLCDEKGRNPDINADFIAMKPGLADCSGPLLGLALFTC